MSIKTVPAVPAGKGGRWIWSGDCKKGSGEREMQLPRLCLQLEGDIKSVRIIVKEWLLAEHSVRARCSPICLLRVPEHLHGGYDPHFSDEDAEPREGKTHPQDHTQQSQDLNPDPTPFPQGCLKSSFPHERKKERQERLSDQHMQGLQQLRPAALN